MVSRRIQQRVRQFVIWIIRPLAQLGVTPNTLTIIGLILSALTAIVVAQGFFLAGGLLVLFAGIFDMFDGAMARVRNAASVFGAFFDSTLDRYSESIILFGLLYYALQRPDLHDVFWPFSSEQSWMIILIYITVVGSLMVSYAKARAEGLGLECKTGLLARPERVVILAIGLLSGTTIWALALLALFSHITAIERIAYIWRVTHQSVEAPLVATQMEVGPDVFTENADSSTNNRHSSTVTGTNKAKDPSLRPVPTSVPPFTGGVHQE